MVQEAAVLLRVEHFKKSTRRITIVALSDLVNFIDKYEGVFSFYTLQGLNNLSRERSRDSLSINVDAND